MAKQNLIQRAGTAIRERIRGLVFPGYVSDSWGGGSRNWYDLSQWFGGYYSGSRINYQVEVGDPSTSSLVMAAVNWVGDRLPEAELQIVETDGEDNERSLPGHDLVKLLRRPNPYYSGATLWKHFAFSWVMDGNVYWWLLYDARGRVVEVWPLPHWMVFPRWNATSNYIDYYEYQVNGVSRYIPPIHDTASDYSMGRVLQFRDGIDPTNARLGLSRLKSVYREMYGDNEIANFSAALMKNTGVPPLLITFKESIADVDKDMISKLQADTQRKISGDERGKVMVASWPMEVQHLAFDPESLDLRKLRFMSEERFAAVIGIPVEVLGFGASGDHSTYNNVESAQRDAVQRYLVPLWRYIDEELSHQFLTQRQYRATDAHRVRHDLSTVHALQESENEKAKRIREDVLAGILKVKDAQMMRGWPPDESADYYLRPGTHTIVSSDYAQRQLEAQDAGLNAAAGMAKNPPEEKPAMNGSPAQKLLPGRSLPIEYAAKSIHEFSTTQVNIDGYAAQAMMDFAMTIPSEELGEGGIETEPHITVRYGLHVEDAEEVRRIVENFSIIRGAMGRTDYFEMPEGDVLYVAIESPDLHLLNRTLGQNLPNTQTQAEYTPHATIAYLKPGMGKKYAGNALLVGYEIIFYTMTFSNKNKVRTIIPLIIPSRAASQ
jgi:HK97 family phage portal protein